MESPLYKRIKLRGGTYQYRSSESNDEVFAGTSPWNSSEYTPYRSQQIPNDRGMCKRNWDGAIVGTPRSSQMLGIASQRNANILLVGSQPVTVNKNEISVQGTPIASSSSTSTAQMHLPALARPQTQIPMQNNQYQCNNLDITSNIQIFAKVFKHTESCLMTPTTSCNLDFCRQMKDLLKHKKNCALGSDCPTTNCSRSRIIIDQWINRKTTDCANICEPFQNLNKPNGKPTLLITEEDNDDNTKGEPGQNSSCQTHEYQPTSNNVVRPDTCDRYSNEMRERPIEADNLEIKEPYPDGSRTVHQIESNTENSTQSHMPPTMTPKPVNQIYFGQSEADSKQHHSRPSLPPPLSAQSQLQKPKKQQQKHDPILREKQRSLTQPIRTPNTLHVGEHKIKSSVSESKDRNHSSGNNHLSSDRKKKNKSERRNREIPSTVIKERQQQEPISPRRKSSSSRHASRKAPPTLAANDDKLEVANGISRMAPATMIDRQQDTQRIPKLKARNMQEDVLRPNNECKTKKTEITAPAKNVKNPDVIGEEKSKRSRNSEADVKAEHSNAKKPYAFSQHELSKALMPTLEKLIGQNPESYPFLEPVDPILLRIPTYPKIIKKPMDLGTIKSKLKSGAYLEPWAYIEDVWLMFENAWLFNGPRSTIYRYCSKLSEVFKQEIGPVMQKLGYCCAMKYKLHPPVLRCYGNKLCFIPKYAKYYFYEKKFQICDLCFQSVSEEVVTLEDDQPQSESQPQIKIKKKLFTEKTNDETEPEQFIKCIQCGREQHQICELYLEQMWPNGFVCEYCLIKKGEKREANKFNATRLQKNRLGIYIESRVNDFLQKKKTGANKVYIRVLASYAKTTEVKPLMRARYVEKGKLNGNFPYRGKAIFAFQKVDGKEVCIFAMHVQEYNSECPSPNTRRVYLAYIDSVHYFRPAQYRTAVYQEILLGYMDYVKQLGYTMLHIWACPPAVGDDYIFNCHSSEQKMPNSLRLQRWYQKLLDKGVQEKIILEVKDVLSQVLADNIESITEIPYFEGDYWPKVYEEKIKVLQPEVVTAGTSKSITSDKIRVSGGVGVNQKNLRNIPTLSKSSKIPRKNCKSSSVYPPVDDLKSQIINEMKKHKQVFYIVHLHSAESASRLGPIQDPDSDIYCSLMEQQDTFLVFAREQRLEFSSMRRAQFSTLVLLYKLHNITSLEFSCNNCSKPIQARYQCPICPDYDLCVRCKAEIRHEHVMKELDLDLYEDSRALRAIQDKKKEDAKMLPTEYCIEKLEHVVACREEDNCPLPYCESLKRVAVHYSKCRLNASGGCSDCKQLIELLYYAKNRPTSNDVNAKDEYDRIHRALQQILKQSQSEPKHLPKVSAENVTVPAQSSLATPELPESQLKRSSIVRPTREDMGPVRASAVARIARSQQPNIERPSSSTRMPVFSQITAPSPRASCKPSPYIHRGNPVPVQPRGRPPLDPRTRNDMTKQNNHTQPRRSQTKHRSSSSNWRRY